jgi:predicted nucleic acid-binding Zn ribbon protein
MNNIQDLQSGRISQDPDTKSVTPSILNTHCIVCGSAFETARAGKLFCSPRCKQFAYNHKSEIIQALEKRDRGISPKPLTFFIDDFFRYDNMQRMLRRYRELKKKNSDWESANQELKTRNQMQVHISSYLIDSYVGKKLTEEEDSELYNAETELDDEIIELNPRELSIEQWSFIKSLHPSLDELSFFSLVSSMSKEFLNQLKLSESESKQGGYVTIKNKFINHCNLIATGVIKFGKREEPKDE